MAYNIEIHAQARQDFRHITNYITFVLCSNQAATNFYNRVEQKLNKIAKNPYGYAEVPFGKYWYRKATVGKYIIAFRIDEQTHTVHIIAIGHSLQKRSNITKGRE